MRDFLTVFRFELLGMLKTKAFMVSTVIICIMLIVGLSIPSIVDTFSDKSKASPEEGVAVESALDSYGYINKDNAVKNIEDLKASFPIGQLIEYESEDKLKESILAKEIEAGFIIESPTKYKYVVENNEMIDSKAGFFQEALIRTYRIYELEGRGISYSEIEYLMYPNIDQDTIILGKDSAGNYMYTYILLFIVYFVVVLYGQMIATSVASEKSNRAMELLITSTDSRNLIFGKVLGVASAGVIQVSAILLVAMVSYRLNANSWGNRLDFIFHIPLEVILTFSVFGILGYIFYAFIFGALGALVSRTEDVSSSSTPITIIFVAVFFMSFISMYNVEGLLLKVISYIPFSSFMAMFIRVSMGTVKNIEILISLLILVISTVFMGVFASKIYGMGTLMYGNPIKLMTAIKMMREK